MDRELVGQLAKKHKPEEEKEVRTAIGAVCAKKAREEMS